MALPRLEELAARSEVLLHGRDAAHLIYLVREGRILQGICGHEYYFRMPYDRKNLALAPGTTS